MRLLFLRTALKKLTRKAVADALGIHVKRLQTYEIARVPLPNEVGLRFCARFDVSQRWLALGKGEPFGAKDIPPDLKAIIEDCRLFSGAYSRHLYTLFPAVPDSLKGFLQDKSPELARQGVAFSLAGVTYGYGLDSPAEMANALGDHLSLKLSRMAPEKRVQFRNYILQAVENFDSSEKMGVDTISQSGNTQSVKSELEKLIQRLKAATKSPGLKAELARSLGVAPTRISEWLSGAREPGGNYTLQLLRWVVQHERQK
jgi:transcriptional regulator with XRE-family HTH domain